MRLACKPLTEIALGGVVYSAPDWLAKRAKLSAEKLALIDTVGGREFTYSQFDQNTNRTANWLQQTFDIRRGDAVAILSTNCVEYLELLFACNKIGATLQVLNWRLSADEVERLLSFTLPKVLVYNDDFIGLLEAIRQSEKTSQTQYVGLQRLMVQSDFSYQSRNECESTFVRSAAIPESTAWVIAYTGGSTGLPKGVVMTHGTIMANAINTAISWGLDEKDVSFCNAPLSHTSGLNIVTTPLIYMGGTLIVCKRFDADEMLRAMTNYPVTIVFGVPTVFGLMVQSELWEQTDLTLLKFAAVGGAPCPKEIMEAFWSKGANFWMGYGLTEAGPNNFYMPPESARSKVGSVGYPVSNVRMKVIDRDGKQITMPDRVGELCIRGDHVTSGYMDNMAATVKAIDADGWLHTGDVAAIDEDGVFSILGRLSDMYISGGENIYPAELEHLLYQHEDVSEACVFGVSDEKWGEVGCAIVVRCVGSDISVEELKAYLRERIARFKVPHHMELATELFKTEVGKLDRQKIRSAFLKRQT